MDATMLSPELNQRYEQQRQSLPAEVEGYYLQTPLGPVWTMEAGRKDAPPLIALHGLHTPAPFNLELLWPLTQHFRVISPDIPGQAGKTPGIAPLPSHHAYALWLEQVMDSLEIASCPMVGLSFGGAVLLDLAALNPKRISAASLIVPAGFFRPLWRPLTKLVLPLVSFKLNSDQTHFDSLMKPLMGDNWPELEAYYFATFQAGIPMTLMPPGPYHLENLVDFYAPVQMFTASEDVYFAPDKLAEKARLALGSLKEVHEIQDFHIPSSENRQFIQRECVRFLCSKSA
ncbi:alpha/beta hydrolase [Neptuniibacter sp.]|uniref:alpha/beta hydrolase n=1 Tax=Neptuniibacter sp. TaxID=1962643 RepID=UPI0026208F6B|nr:alpha/beta hydrolase [Neptuniibacter sp.]MCP4596350.1 alpha/beta fold hydrolase [Neptuniibacter sp.]